MSEALSTGQQVFNQRLLAAHCLSEPELTKLYKSLQEQQEDLQGVRMTETMGACNAQLQYLGLEIVAVILPSEEEDDHDDDQNNKNIRHYAMVNKFPDDISKICFQSHIFQPPEQQSYVKAVLQKLVDSISGSTEDEDDDGDENTSRNRTPATRQNKITRATLLNLNRDAKITLASAEECLDRLLDEKWLLCNNQKRTNQSLVRLGPRAYGELSYLLTEEFGMEASDLPQQILLR